jgi:creatinine amidohydrolase/Fe(II)-dependent formamide hydrolase-like protein
MQTVKSPWFVPVMTFPEIRRRIELFPCAILPVAGMEPAGMHGTVGAGSIINMAIADVLSVKTGALLFPSLNYGYSTPYSSFAGCFGIKQAALESVLADIIASSVRQGVSCLYIIDGSFDNMEAVERAVKYSARNSVSQSENILAWQRNKTVSEFIKTQAGITWMGRCEYGILSMSAAIGLLKESDSGNCARDTDWKKYNTWMRRGRDPEKFKKLFPEGIVSHQKHDAVFGKSLLDFITGHFSEIISTGGK